MSFLTTLVNAVKSDNNAETSLPATAHRDTNGVGSHGNTGQAEVPALTVYELDRRVNFAFTKAIEQKNEHYLLGVAAFVQSSSSLSETTANITVRTPEAAKEIYTWCVANYEDLIEGIQLQLICSTSSNSKEISQAQATYAVALSLAVEQQLRPKFAPVERKSQFDESDSAIVAVIRFSGRGISSLLKRTKDFVRLQAEMEYAGNCSQPGDKPIPARMREVLYLADVLSQIGNPAIEKAHEVQPETPAPTAPAAPTTNVTINVFELPVELRNALESRMALIRRRMGLEGGGWTPNINRGFVAEFKRALKENDPLEIASIACEFWLVGRSLKPGSAALSRYETKTGLEINNQPAEVVSAPSPTPSIDVARPNKPPQEELITTDELALRIHYDVRTLRERLKDRVLLHEVHYIRPFGGRKILWRWDAIQKTLGINEHATGTKS